MHARPVQDTSLLFSGQTFPPSSIFEEHAFIYDSLHLLASDIDAVKELVLTYQSAADEKLAEKIERSFHTLCAICKFRAGELKNAFPDSSGVEALTVQLNQIRTTLGAIRFLPPEDFVDDFSDLMQTVTQSFASIVPGSEFVSLEHYDLGMKGPSERIYAEIERLSRDLIVNLEDPRQQIGFRCPLERDELQEELSRPGAHLFLLQQQHDVCGMAILHSERQAIPEPVSDLISKFEGHTQCRSGYLSTIGIDPRLSLQLYRHGISSYELLTGVIRHACVLAGIDRVYGEVRIGSKTPNVSVKSHLRIGFTLTGLRRKSNGYLYELGVIDPRKLPYYLHSSLHGCESTEEIKSTNMPQLRSIMDQWDFRDPDTVAPDEICCPGGDESEVETILRVFKESGKIPHDVRHRFWPCSDGLALQFDVNSRLYTLRQLFPNQDLWTFDDDTSCQKITPFYAALEKVHQAILGWKSKFELDTRFRDFTSLYDTVQGMSNLGRSNGAAADLDLSMISSALRDFLRE